MNIEEFITTHPWIKYNALEKYWCIPTGTIKPGKRKIPEKYIKLIEEALKDYGYAPECSQIIDKPIPIPEVKPTTVSIPASVPILSDEVYCVVQSCKLKTGLGKWDIYATLPEGTMVKVIKS
jgi:hypothetical protein